MARMDGSGPDKSGPGVGRGLGLCRGVLPDESINKLGKGMGLRRHSGGGEGKGKRLKTFSIGRNHEERYD